MASARAHAAHVVNKRVKKESHIVLISDDNTFKSTTKATKAVDTANNYSWDVKSNNVVSKGRLEIRIRAKAPGPAPAQKKPLQGKNLDPDTSMLTITLTDAAVPCVMVPVTYVDDGGACDDGM
jgi:hypothetical protein